MFRWKLLCGFSEKQLAALDVAEMNLACAEGLPDAKNIDASACLKWLDNGAAYVRQYTDKMLPQFHGKPHEFKNSEARFRVLCMITVLQRDLGLRYNPEKIPADEPLDTADTFIHGAILGNGGTCASLPVIYAAVGRRLGYPIRLVAAKVGWFGHLFARWDDPHGERFNIECTNKGFNSFTDDYYRTGVYAITPEIERLGCLLRSMTPREELADFMTARGNRWVAFGRDREAVNSFAWALALAPYNIIHADTFKYWMKKWGDKVTALQPPGFPSVHITWPPRPGRTHQTPRQLLLEA